jgi:hypothetical protein
VHAYPSYLPKFYLNFVIIVNERISIEEPVENVAWFVVIYSRTAEALRLKGSQAKKGKR